MTPETARRQRHPDLHDERTFRRSMATTASGAVPALRILLIAGLAAAVVLAVLGYGGLGLIDQEVAIVALGAGLVTVAIVLFFLLMSLRATHQTVDEIVHMHEQQYAEVTRAPEPAPAHPVHPQPVHALPARLPPEPDGEVEVFQRAHDNDHILRIRGIDDTDAALLNRASVYTIADLRAADPVDLARHTGLPAERVETWCGEADLLRVPGIGPAEAALLTQNGIRSVDELAHADRERLARVLASRGPVRQVQVQKRPIDDHLVGHWIENARYEVHHPMSVHAARTLR